MGPFVCIYASQVAMCIGANKHKKINEALEMMWQRVDHTGFWAAMKRNRLKTESELADDIIATHQEIKQLVQSTLAEPCDSSDQVALKYHEVAKELQAVKLHDEERRLVDDVLKKNLYTAYGNVQETNVLNYIRTRLGIECQEDPTFYKREHGVCSGPWGDLPWFVGGKIDAIDRDRTLLIEIKNRVNRLFHRVPFYEQVQVQTYLELLGLHRGVLVECLKTDPTKADPTKADPAKADPAKADPTKADPAKPRNASDRDPDGDHPSDRDPDGLFVNVIHVQRDRHLWNKEIVPKLRGFVDFLARILHDPCLQDRYLQSRRRSAMITTHVNNWIKFN